MRVRAVRTARLALAALLLAVAGCDLQCPGSDRPVRRAIRIELQHLPISRARPLRVEAGEVSELVRRFYRERHDRPGWVTPRGARESAHRLVQLLERSGERGLDPKNYPTRRIRVLLGRTDPALHGPRPDAYTLARLDVDCTAAWLELATHLLRGRVHPRAFDPDWHHEPRSRDLLSMLDGALEEGSLGAALDSLEPAMPADAALRRGYARYRAIAAAGGWNAVPDGPPLKAGAKGPRVAALARRLEAEGDLDPGAPPPAMFDARLRGAVLRYQRRCGLEPTGIVGPAEVEALNVPAGERARQIAFSLERLRWMPDTLESRYAWIDIPEYELQMVEDGHAAFRCRVVVGRDSSRTPCFRAALKLMVLNPYWRIPPRIAASEMLDEIRRDPQYLARNGIRVMEGSGPGAREVDPAKVNWGKLGPGNFNYRLLQDPGPENAVGHVKFMCPNPYSVYLHDTPATWLFQKPERAFSHGCVRVEQPLALARYLLRDKPGWDSLRIATAFDTCTNTVVFLPEPVPVHIVYFTAWPDSDGSIRFRRDVYGLDAALADALKGVRPPPRRATTVMPGAGPVGPRLRNLPASPADRPAMASFAPPAPRGPTSRSRGSGSR